MRKTLIALTIATVTFTSSAIAGPNDFMGGGSGGYYYKGIGGSFVKLMAEKGERVGRTTSSGSPEIIDSLCNGSAGYGVFQADSYALKRAENRALSRCVFTAGQVREEAVLMAGPDNLQWRDLRGPNMSDTLDRDGDGNTDHKWVVIVKQNSGAEAPADLISKNDPKIAANVIFERVPREQYDFGQILADIEYGDADGVLWTQSLSPNEGDMQLVLETKGVDFIPTGFKQYAEEIQVGGRRKAPVYRVETMPIESKVIGKADLLVGGGRKIDLLMVAVLGGVSSSVDEKVRAKAIDVFKDPNVAPATSFAQEVMDYYAKGMSASKEAWASMSGDSDS